MSYADFADPDRDREPPDPLDVTGPPVEPGTERVVYFATVSIVRRRAEPMVPAGEVEMREATISPAVTTLDALGGWLADHAAADDDVTIIRRTITSTGTRDETVVDHVPDPDRERLDGLVRDTRDALTGAVPRRLPRPGDRTAHASTEVTEGEGARSQVMARAEATRQQRMSEPRVAGVDARAPMLTYADVYDEKGEPRPPFTETVEEMRVKSMRTGRGH